MIQMDETSSCLYRGWNGWNSSCCYWNLSRVVDVFFHDFRSFTRVRVLDFVLLLVRLLLRNESLPGSNRETGTFPGSIACWRVHDSVCCYIYVRGSVQSNPPRTV
jgi:hypothetical protein